MTDKSKEGDKARANEGEKTSRILAVLEWLRTPLTRQQILANAEEWDLQPRQIDNYIHEAKELLRQSFIEGMEENKAIIVSKFWEIYNVSLRGPRWTKDDGEIESDEEYYKRVSYKPDLSAANIALKNIAHIQGLLISKVDVGLSTDDELEDVPTEVLITYGKSVKKDTIPNNHRKGGPIPDPS